MNKKAKSLKSALAKIKPEDISIHDGNLTVSGASLEVLEELSTILGKSPEKIMDDAIKAELDALATHTEIALDRTDRRPIAFNGRLLAKDSTRSVNGPNQTRWQVCSIYETDSKKYIVGIENVTCWQGERDFDRADVFDKIEDAITHIEEHAPALVEGVIRLLKKDGISVVERV